VNENGGPNRETAHAIAGKRVDTPLVLGVARCWRPIRGAGSRAFREKVKQTVGRGRAGLQVWPQVCMATVIKHTEKQRGVEVTRKMTLGTLAQASHLLQASRGGRMLNTTLIVRLNGRMRVRLAALTRTCRHEASRLVALEAGMYLIWCSDKFCWPHQELSSRRQVGHPCTPAMASGLTDHIGSVTELVAYKLAPSPWVEPKRRGRHRKLA
jgi:hypothetical protein